MKGELKKNINSIRLCLMALGFGINFGFKVEEVI